MKTNHMHLLLFLFILSLGACHPSAPQMKELKIASTMMEEHPDTALYLLQKIPQPELLQEEEYATYCLLKTQAEDKNGITHSSDEIIKVAAAYFSEHPNLILREKSYYYMARVEEDMGNDVLACANFLSALKLAEKRRDYKEIAVICNRLSEVYVRLNSYDEALNMQKNASHNYLLLNKQKSFAPFWVLIVVSLVVLIGVVVTVFFYRSYLKKKNERIRIAEKQLNHAKSTIAEQKNELQFLRKEVKSMKKVFYESSDIIKKIHQINNKNIAACKEVSSFTEREWNLFLTLLEDTYGFISHLKKSYPRLTDMDIRICALLKEGMPTTHISSVLNMSVETLTRRMQRIKTDKMNHSGQAASLKAIIQTV